MLTQACASGEPDPPLPGAGPPAAPSGHPSNPQSVRAFLTDHCAPAGPPVPAARAVRGTPSPRPCAPDAADNEHPGYVSFTDRPVPHPQHICWPLHFVPALP